MCACCAGTSPILLGAATLLAATPAVPTEPPLVEGPGGGAAEIINIFQKISISFVYFVCMELETILRIWAFHFLLFYLFVPLIY